PCPAIMDTAQRYAGLRTYRNGPLTTRRRGWGEGCRRPVSLAHEAHQKIEERRNGEDRERAANPSRRSPCEERRVELPTREQIRTEHDHRSCEEGREGDRADHREPGGPLSFLPRIARHEPVLPAALWTFGWKSRVDSDGAFTVSAPLCHLMRQRLLPRSSDCPPSPQHRSVCGRAHQIWRTRGASMAKGDTEGETRTNLLPSSRRVLAATAAMVALLVGAHGSVRADGNLHRV